MVLACRYCRFGFVHRFWYSVAVLSGCHFAIVLCACRFLWLVFMDEIKNLWRRITDYNVESEKAFVFNPFQPIYTGFKIYNPFVNNNIYNLFYFSMYFYGAFLGCLLLSVFVINIIMQTKYHIFILYRLNYWIKLVLENSWWLLILLQLLDYCYHCNYLYNL